MELNREGMSCVAGLASQCLHKPQCLAKCVWKVSVKKKKTSEVDRYEKYATDKIPLLDFYFEILLFQNYLSSFHNASKKATEDI